MLGKRLVSASGRKPVRTRWTADQFRPRLVSLEQRCAAGSLLGLGLWGAEASTSSYQFDTEPPAAGWRPAAAVVPPADQNPLSPAAGLPPASIVMTPTQPTDVGRHDSSSDTGPAFDLASPRLGGASFVFLPPTAIPPEVVGPTLAGPTNAVGTTTVTGPVVAPAGGVVMSPVVPATAAPNSEIGRAHV